MVKLRGPLFSQQASGPIAKAVQFANTGRQTVAGRYRQPKQPRTQAQRSVRAFLGQLAALWQELTPAQQATWANAPHAHQTSPYHAWQKWHTNRYKHLPNKIIDCIAEPVWPSQTYPPLKNSVPSFFDDEQIAGGKGTITITLETEDPLTDWLFLCHYANPGDTLPTYKNFLHMQTVEPHEFKDVLIENLTPGEYTLAYQMVSKSGKPMPGWITLPTATVT